jgi:hypothetical protein
MSEYGRSDDDWAELAQATRKFLIERARLRGTTSYTELNAVLARRTGLPQFDFEEAHERAAMGHLLGLVTHAEHPDSGLMLSALVQYLNANDAGPGFYQLAQQLGLLPTKASEAAKLEFWIRQVKEVHAYFGKTTE